VFEKNNPYDLLMTAIEIVNEHTLVFETVGIEMDRQERLLEELVKQNQMLLKNIKVMNQHVKLINQRLAHLEGKNNAD